MTDNPKYPYDVAISFLSGDEPLAAKVYEQLSENLSVFVYSKKQEQLAGTDGLESFRQAFFSQSRLIVVLYRDGWGKTRWTGIEELAIKDRMFDGGWKHLLFVMLDQQCTYPAWLPETHVRLDYMRFADNLVGAIKLRALELGGELKIETALVKARRMEMAAMNEATRCQKLMYEAGASVRTEWAILRRTLEGKTAEIKTHFNLQFGADDSHFIIRTDVSGYIVALLPVNNASDSHITVGAYLGKLKLPEEPAKFVHLPGSEPKRIYEHTYCLDFDAAFGWCWRAENGQLLKTESLGELILKKVLELYEQVKSGNIPLRGLRERLNR